MRGIIRLLAGAAIAGWFLYLWLGGGGLFRGDQGTAKPSKSFTERSSSRTTVPARETWGNMASLPDHFARHGSEFGARNPEDYAGMAWQFLQRAKAEGLPAKVDGSGVLRVFDPGSGAFGAYNRDGTTKTFFKPGRRGYFDRQPGQPVNLRTAR